MSAGPDDAKESRSRVFIGGRVGGVPLIGRWRVKRDRTYRPRPSSDEPRTELGEFLSRSSVRRILGGLTSLSIVIGIGTAGYVLLGWNPFDALLMVVITVSGVGFGEVHPLNSPWLRIHTMFVIAMGLISVAYTVAGFVQFVAEGEIQHLLGHQRVRRQIELLQDHTIVAGYGRMGSLLCADLLAAGDPFVLVENSGTRIQELEQLGILYIVGDATEEKVLQEAGLERAKSLVTTIPSDASNVFITLTARQLSAKIMIVARAEQPSTQRKLHHAGANHVVVPAAIGAHRIASLLTNPSAVEFAELVTQRSSLAIEMDEFPVISGGSFEGQTLRDTDIGRRTGVIVIAVKRADGHVEFPPVGDRRFVSGDVIVLLGRRTNLDQFRHEFKRE
jgi:voltage-gated potassium channel